MLFFLLLQRAFNVCLEPSFTFFLFLLQKDFDIFRVLLFGVFLCVFDNIKNKLYELCKLRDM